MTLRHIPSGIARSRGIARPIFRAAMARTTGWFPESWKIIINGFVDRFLYSEGSLDQSLPLAGIEESWATSTRAAKTPIRIRNSPSESARAFPNSNDIRPRQRNNRMTHGSQWNEVMEVAVRVNRSPAAAETGAGSW